MDNCNKKQLKLSNVYTFNLPITHSRLNKSPNKSAPANWTNLPMKMNYAVLWAQSRATQSDDFEQGSEASERLHERGRKFSPLHRALVRDVNQKGPCPKSDISGWSDSHRSLQT